MAQAAARRARRERAAGPVAVALAVGLALVGATAGCAGPATDATAGDEQAQALAASGTADPTAAPELTAPSPEPMVTASPDAFSQVGDLVEGFPIDLRERIRGGGDHRLGGRGGELGGGRRVSGAGVGKRLRRLVSRGRISGGPRAPRRRTDQGESDGQGDRDRPGSTLAPGSTGCRLGHVSTVTPG